MIEGSGSATLVIRRIRININVKNLIWIQNTALLTVHIVWSVWCIPGQVVEETPILIEVGDKPKLCDDSLVLVVCRNEAENILMPAIFVKKTSLGYTSSYIVPQKRKINEVKTRGGP